MRAIVVTTNHEKSAETIVGESKQLMSPYSDKMDMPEKIPIPGIEVIGEFSFVLSSSIFLSVSLICSSIISMSTMRCLIYISIVILLFPTLLLAAQD